MASYKGIKADKKGFAGKRLILVFKGIKAFITRKIQS